MTTATTDTEFWTNSQRGIVGVFRQADDGSRIAEPIHPGQEFAMSRVDRELNQRAVAVKVYDPFSNGTFVRTAGDGTRTRQVSAAEMVGGRAPFKVDRAAAAEMSGQVAGAPEVTGVPGSPAPTVAGDDDLKAILATRRVSEFETQVGGLAGDRLARLAVLAEEARMSPRQLTIINQRREALASDRAVPPVGDAGAVAEVPDDAVPPVTFTDGLDVDASGVESGDYTPPAPRPARRAAMPGSEFGEQAIYAMGETDDMAALGNLGFGEGNVSNLTDSSGGD